MSSFGVQTCDNGIWSATYSGLVDRVAEVCDNGVDGDCDGDTDGADADCAAAAGHVVISQVFHDTPGTDSIEEFVELYNPQAQAWTCRAGSWRTAPARGRSPPAACFLRPDG